MYTLRVRKWRDIPRRFEEVCQTVDQLIRAYEGIGIDSHTLTLALQGAEVELRQRIEAKKKGGGGAW